MIDGIMLIVLGSLLTDMTIVVDKLYPVKDDNLSWREIRIVLSRLLSITIGMIIYTYGLFLMLKELWR